jgi:hypothetical protein
MHYTPAQTAIRYLVFKDDGVWYASALELGTVVDEETPEKALLSLIDAIKGVMEVQNDPEYAEKTFYTPPIDPEHEIMWREGQATIAPVESPFQIYTTGLLCQVA